MPYTFRFTSAWLLPFVFVAATAATAPAATIVISPGDGPSPLADGFRAAQSGDKIIIKKGRYDERVSVNDVDDLRIIGKRGAVIVSPDQSAALQLINCDRVTVQGLTFEASTGLQMNIVGGATTTVKKCRFIGAATGAITASGGTDLTIERCTFDGADSAVSASDFSRLTVSRSTINVTRVGCALTQSTAGASADCVFEKNRVSGTEFTAFNVRGLRVRVAKNRVEDCGQGVSLIINADDAVVEKNTFRRSGQGGTVFTSSQRTTITKNKYFALGGGAISVHALAGEAMIEKNKIKGTKGDAIRVGGAGATVTRNKVQDVEGRGILVVGVDGTYEKNVVTNATTDGIRIHTAGNTFIKNSARGSGGSDLFSTRPVEDNTFTNNKFGVSNIALE